MTNVDKARRPWSLRPRWAAALLALVLCASSHAANWALPDLMQALAQNKSGSARFVEKKYIGILDKPLESSGELSFVSPRRLEKRTLQPRAESLVLDGDRLTVTLHEKQPLYLRLKDHPDVAALVESIRSTLGGDLATLEKNYTLALAGSPGKWQLTLTPVPPALSKVVRQIQIGGAGANLQSIAFDQADGDRIEMTILPAVAAP